MNRAIADVTSAQITYAVRDTQIDDLKINEGDILGLLEGKITQTGKNPEDVLKVLAENMCDDDTEFFTVYYGEDVSKETADELLAFLEEEYPDIEISMKKGGQPLYYYILSAE